MMTDNTTEGTVRQAGFQFQQRWLMRASAAVMVALMTVATFSVGYWYGSDGSGGTASFAGPGGFGGGQQGGPGGGFGTNALSRQPDLVGQIQSISGDLVTMQTQAGTQVLTLTEDTEVFLSDGTPGTTEDLEDGLFAAVVGTPGDGGLSMTVDEIGILPARR